MCTIIFYSISHVVRSIFKSNELAQRRDQDFSTQDVSVVRGMCFVKSNTSVFFRKCHFLSPGGPQKGLGDIFLCKIKK